MDQWPYNDKVKPGYSPGAVQRWCVQHEEWQALRLKMKGVPTRQKLQMLLEWWEARYTDFPMATEIQVGNYLGALRRGGQLDIDNRVRKEI